MKVTSLHPKICKPIFFGDVKSTPNYTKKLILMGKATTTLDMFNQAYTSLYFKKLQSTKDCTLHQEVNDGVKLKGFGCTQIVGQLC